MLGLLINYFIYRRQQTLGFYCFFSSDGYHMFTPATTKREQIRRQAEKEQREYEAHIERTRLHDIHEVNRLGAMHLF